MALRGKLTLGILLLATSGWLAAASHPARSFQEDNPDPPDQTVKLIFIHHSTGENWLRDDYGGLGAALDSNHYFVSDTNYGWGPEGIGDRTDIPDWLEWFRSGNTQNYMQALYSESGQNSSYTRNLSDPGGENQVVMFKSCFPNSALEGNPDDPPDPEGWLTVGHARFVYNEILPYFADHPDKLFVAVTAPPLQDSTYAENARAFNQWLVNDWLKENGYSGSNVAVFDFYNILTGPEGHHWFQDGSIQLVLADRNTSYYPSSSDDDHPSAKGSRKATEEFVPMLNVFYHRWAAAAGNEAVQPESYSTSAPEAESTNEPSEEPAVEEKGSPLPCVGGLLLPLIIIGLVRFTRAR